MPLQEHAFGRTRTHTHTHTHIFNLSILRIVYEGQRILQFRKQLNLGWLETPPALCVTMYGVGVCVNENRGF